MAEINLSALLFTTSEAFSKLPGRSTDQLFGLLKLEAAQPALISLRSATVSPEV